MLYSNAPCYSRSRFTSCFGVAHADAVLLVVNRDLHPSWQKAVFLCEECLLRWGRRSLTSQTHPAHWCTPCRIGSFGLALPPERPTLRPHVSGRARSTNLARHQEILQYNSILELISRCLRKVESRMDCLAFAGFDGRSLQTIVGVGLPVPTRPFI